MRDPGGRHAPAEPAGCRRRFGDSAIRREGLSRALLESTARGPLRPRRFGAVLPCPRAEGARAMARARRVPRVDPPPRGRGALRLLRGPAHGQRQARVSPRPLARLQGRLPALQDDARPLRAPQGGLGLPRPAGRARDREAARLQGEGGHRALRRGRVQRQVPRVGAALHRRVERADRADRVLDRHGGRVLHARQRLHRVGLVVAEAGLGQGAPDRGPQGRAVLPALRHRAVEPRGGARLQGRGRPLGVREVPAARRPGRVASRVDHDALDARAARRDRGGSRGHLRSCPREP